MLIMCTKLWLQVYVAVHSEFDVYVLAFVCTGVTPPPPSPPISEAHISPSQGPWGHQWDSRVTDVGYQTPSELLQGEMV